MTSTTAAYTVSCIFYNCPPDVHTDSVAEALDAFGDGCRALCHFLHDRSEDCRDNDHYGYAMDGEECEDCEELGAYSDLLMDTDDSVHGHSQDDLPDTVTIMSDTVTLADLQAYGIDAHAPSGIIFPYSVTLNPHSHY